MPSPFVSFARNFGIVGAVAAVVFVVVTEIQKQHETATAQNVEMGSQRNDVYQDAREAIRQLGVPADVVDGIRDDVRFGKSVEILMNLASEHRSCHQYRDLLEFADDFEFEILVQLLQSLPTNTELRGIIDILHSQPIRVAPFLRAVRLVDEEDWGLLVQRMNSLEPARLEQLIRVFQTLSDENLQTLFPAILGRAAN